MILSKKKKYIRDAVRNFVTETQGGIVLTLCPLYFSN